MRVQSGIGAVLGALGWLACGSFGSDGATAPPAPEPGPADVVTAVDAATADAPEADATAGCPDRIVYVAPSGNDTNSGCDPKAPKATIGAAIAYVKTLGAADHEIHACRGTYEEEDLVLDYPVSLRGGYECSLWTRREPFGFVDFDRATGAARGFDATNESTLAPRTGTVTLAVTGKAITRAVAVEGFTLRGTESGGGITLRIEGGASPTISNDVIHGAVAGLAAGAIAGSIAIDVADDSAPEIAKDRIEGGSGGGAAANWGSVGVRLHSKGATLLHDNEIDSGNGTGALIETIGVLVDLPSVLVGDQAIAHNTIFHHGTGETGNVATYGTVLFGNTKADLVENRYVGGKIACKGAACNAFALFIAGSGSRVLRNRIYVGDMTASPEGVFASGIQIAQAGEDIDVYDNLIDLGAGGKATGIFATPTGAQRRIAHNTIYSGVTTNTAGIVSLGADASVDDNLLLGVGTGLSLASCKTTADPPVTYVMPAHVRNNAFVGTTALAQELTNDCLTAGVVATTVAALDQMLGAIGSSNIAMQASCSDTPARCQTCTGGAACVAKALASTPTLPQLLGPGWKLAPAGWCVLQRGGIQLDAVPIDANSAPRTPPVSIGALETDSGACVP